MDARSVELIAVSTALAFLALVATLLRFYARRLSRLPFGLDDYIIVAGLVLAWGICACNIAGAVVAKVGSTSGLGNYGIYTGHPTAEQSVKFGHYFYALQILHTCAMPVIKLSVLAFYQRMFSTSRTFKIACRVIGIYIAVWWFSTIMVTIFQCWPIQNNWSTDYTAYATCIPHENIFYSISALTNVISDAAILIVPIPIVLSLQMRRHYKIAALAMFLTGSLVIVAGIARTVAFFTTADIFNYYDNFPFIIWTTAEPTLATISACLPTFRPFLGDLSSRPLIRSLTSIFSSSNTRNEPQQGHTAGENSGVHSNQETGISGSSNNNNNNSNKHNNGNTWLRSDGRVKGGSRSRSRSRSWVGQFHGGEGRIGDEGRWIRLDEKVAGWEREGGG